MLKTNKLFFLWKWKSCWSFWLYFTLSGGTIWLLSCPIWINKCAESKVFRKSRVTRGHTQYYFYWLRTSVYFFNSVKFTVSFVLITRRISNLSKRNAIEFIEALNQGVYLKPCIFVCIMKNVFPWRQWLKKN